MAERILYGEPDLVPTGDIVIYLPYKSHGNSLMSRRADGLVDRARDSHAGDPVQNLVIFYT